MAEFPERIPLYDNLPLFMQSFKEMREIFQSAEPQIDNLYDAMSTILDNMFIDDADEYGISKYEDTLKILPEDGEDIEVRRARVKIRWNDYIPYTVKTLKDKLDAICGVGQYTLDMDLENYYIYVGTQIRSEAVRQEVELMLEKILPANIVYEVSVIYNTWDVIKAHTWGELKTSTWEQVRIDTDL